MRSAHEKAIAYDKGVNFARKCIEESKKKEAIHEYIMSTIDLEPVEFPKETEMSIIEKNQVWRTASDKTIGGYFVWEVIQVVGEPFPSQLHMYTQCRDGSYVVIQCSHFFTLQKAGEFLHSPDAFQTLTIVP